MSSRIRILSYEFLIILGSLIDLLWIGLFERSRNTSEDVGLFLGERLDAENSIEGSHMYGNHHNNSFTRSRNQGRYSMSKY